MWWLIFAFLFFLFLFSFSPIDCGVHDPERGVVRAGRLVRCSHSGGRAHDLKRFGEDILRLCGRIARNRRRRCFAPIAVLMVLLGFYQGLICLFESQHEEKSESSLVPPPPKHPSKQRNSRMKIVSLLLKKYLVIFFWVILGYRHRWVGCTHELSHHKHIYIYIESQLVAEEYYLYNNLKPGLSEGRCARFNSHPL